MTTKMLSLYSTTMTEKMPSLYLSTINPHFSIISWKKKSFPVTGSRNLFTTTVHASRSKVDHQISRSQVIDWLIIKLDRLIKSIELINLFIYSKKKMTGTWRRIIIVDEECIRKHGKGLFEEKSNSKSYTRLG